MINVLETLPGAPAAAAKAGDAAAAAVSQSASSSAPVASDSVAQGQAAVVALAYLPYALGGRNSAANPTGTALEAQREDAFAKRFGSQLALIRAALPSALQGQFVAQVAAAFGGAAGGDPAAEEGTTAFSEPDLAKLFQGGVPGKDDALLSSLVSRLAHDVARYGAAPVANALHLTHDRIAFAAAVGTPASTPADARVARREDEREQQRHERSQKGDERQEKAAPDGSKPTYSIEDVVSYAGETVAMHRMAPPPYIDERNPT